MAGFPAFYKETKMKFNSQKEIIKQHLFKHNSITSWEAITKYKITRLSAHILSLRDEGLNIISTYKRNPKTETNYVQYSIICIK